MAASKQISSHEIGRRKRNTDAMAAVSSKKSRNSGNTAGDWSTAPLDVLGLIATKIRSIQAYVCFGATCRWWRTAANKTVPKLDPSPWLMVAAKDERRFNSSVYGFHTFAAAAATARSQMLEIQLPEIREMICSLCCGSPFGWIVTKGHGFKINLFNPLSKVFIPLPDMHNDFVSKAILTASPASPDCFVFVIHSVNDKLGFAKPGDSVWSVVDSQISWKDIIYFGGKLYGCSITGQVLTLEVSGPQVMAVEFAMPPPALLPDELLNMKYVVDLGGKLCLIMRKLIPDDHYTSGFDIYSLNMSSKEWTRMSSLGNFCLFVGGNYTFSVESSGLFKPGCVYFTDYCNVYLNDGETDAKSRGFDTGVYHVGDDRMEPLLMAPSDPGSLESYPSPPYHEDHDAMYFLDIPPIWITPSLQWPIIRKIANHS